MFMYLPVQRADTPAYVHAHGWDFFPLFSPLHESHVAGCTTRFLTRKSVGKSPSLMAS